VVKTSFKIKVVQAMIMGLMYALIFFALDKFWGEEFRLWKFVFHAVFFGGLVGFLVPLIKESLIKKALNKISIDLSENEELELETAANLNSKLYADGGKLILTDKRLAFKAHDSFKNKVVEIPLSEITEVEKIKTLGFIHNTFKVKTASEEYKFIVYEKERDTWVTALHNSLNYINMKKYKSYYFKKTFYLVFTILFTFTIVRGLFEIDYTTKSVFLLFLKALISGIVIGSLLGFINMQWLKKDNVFSKK